jgi:D-inositol-3-phosphate glycosyltransferase
MPSHYESFGMTALEAMACGIPVIASNVTGVADIIDEKHDYLTTTVNNPLLLASQIQSLLTDEATHKKVSDDVLKDSSEFSWKNTAGRFIKLFESLSKNE